MSGYLHRVVPAGRFRLLSRAGGLIECTFRTRAAKHRCCRDCGIKRSPVARSHPDGMNVHTAAIAPLSRG